MAWTTFFCAFAGALCAAHAYYDLPAPPAPLPEFSPCVVGGTPCQPRLRCAGVPGKLLCLSPQPLGGHCGGHANHFCAAGQRCVKRRCTAFLPLGGACGAFRYCRGRLVCRRGRCAQVSPAGGPCGGPARLCRRGLRCRNRRCVRAVVLVGRGKPCDGRTRKCAAGLRCASGRCAPRVVFLRIGQRCNGVSRKCAKALRCVGKGRKLCRRVVGVRRPCRLPLVVCRRGLQCRNKRCIRPIVRVNRFQRCDGRFRMCKRGSHCVGPDKQKRCIRIMRRNEFCSKPFWVCRRGLRCVKRRCVLPVRFVRPGRRCNGVRRKCRAPFACVGPRNNRRCRRVLGVNGKCDRAHTVCRKGLKCIRKRCRVPVVVVKPFARCGGRFLKCPPRFHCVGPAKRKRCVTVMRRRQFCSKPWWICHSSLRCVKNRCTPPTVIVRPGARCTGRFRKCPPRFTCLRGRCKRIVGLNAVCVGGHVVCRKNLTCRRKRCARPVVFVRPGAKCNGKNIKCRGRFVCVGPPGKKSCRRVLGLGGRCNRRNTVCRPPFRCFNKRCVRLVNAGGQCRGRNRKCKGRLRCIKNKCVTVLNLGGHCNGRNKVCRAGLQCANNRCVLFVRQGEDCKGLHRRCAHRLECVKGKCVRVLSAGGRCTRSNTVCRAPLRCHRTRCVRIVPPGGKCGGPHRKCADGFHCARGICIRVVGANAVCNKPGRVCRAGLKCDAGRCRPLVRTAQPGGKCNGKDVICPDRFTCLRRGAHRHCLKVMGPGGFCGVSWTVCRGNLICVGRKCVAPVVTIQPGRSCAGPNKKCTAGFHCGKGVCIKLVGERSDCGKGGLVCRPKLKCVGGKCKVPIVTVHPGGNCAGKNKRCTNGFHCNKGVCIKLVGERSVCGRGGLVCRLKLKCVGGKCKVPIVTVHPGGNCAGKNKKCTNGFHCNKGVCIKLVGERSVCGKGGLVCRPKLKCVGGKCKVPIVTVHPGGNCAGKNKRCTAGFHCGKGVCIKLVGERSVCGRGGLVCRPKLKCVGGKCKVPVVTIPPGGNCAGSNKKCTRGFHCAKGVCVQVVGEGGVCGKSGLVCRSGFKCAGGRCKAVVKLAEPGGRCDGKGIACAHGFSCVQMGGHKVCMKIMDAGQFCGLSWIACREGLACVNRKCVRHVVHVKFLGSCNKLTEKCTGGTKCHGPSGKRVCVMLQDVGKRCGSPGWVCGRGLKCDGVGNRARCVQKH